MTHGRALALALITAPQACRSADRQAAGAVVQAAVVDSVRRKAWWSNDDSMFAYLFEIRTTAARDTVRDVIAPLPKIAGDTVVIGLTVDDTAEHGRSIFVFDARRRRVQHEPFPSDAWPGLTDFSISPDGEHLLYTTWVSHPMGEVAVIRRRPSGEIVVTGPRWPLCECDSDLHHARWVTADSFEIASGAMGVWERVSGSISRHSLHRDTLRAEPQWH